MCFYDFIGRASCSPKYSIIFVVEDSKITFPDILYFSIFSQILSHLYNIVLQF